MASNTHLAIIVDAHASSSDRFQDGKERTVSSELLLLTIIPFICCTRRREPSLRALLQSSLQYWLLHFDRLCLISNVIKIVIALRLLNEFGWFELILWRTWTIGLQLTFFIPPAFSLERSISTIAHRSLSIFLLLGQNLSFRGTFVSYLVQASSGFAKVFNFSFVPLVCLFKLSISLSLVKHGSSEVIWNGLIELHFITRLHSLVQVVHEIPIITSWVLICKSSFFPFVDWCCCCTLFDYSGFFKLFCLWTLISITFLLKISQRATKISAFGFCLLFVLRWQLLMCGEAIFVSSISSTFDWRWLLKCWTVVTIIKNGAVLLSLPI